MQEFDNECIEVSMHDLAASIRVKAISKSNFVIFYFILFCCGIDTATWDVETHLHASNWYGRGHADIVLQSKFV